MLDSIQEKPQHLRQGEQLLRSGALVWPAVARPTSAEIVDVVQLFTGVLARSSPLRQQQGRLPSSQHGAVNGRPVREDGRSVQHEPRGGPRVRGEEGEEEAEGGGGGGGGGVPTRAAAGGNTRSDG